MKYLAKFFAATALLAVIGMLVVRLWPVSLAEPKLLVRVPAGASLKVAAQTLHDGGVGVPAWVISGVGRVAGLASSIKAGSYEFDQGISLWAMLRKLSSGDTSQADLLLVEGSNFRELRAKLNAQPELLHLTRDMTDAAIMDKLGMAGQVPEGWFFPTPIALTSARRIWNC